MVESLSIWLRQRGEQGKLLISEGMARGILSLCSGEVYSVEELAEEIRVNADLVETCVLLSKLKGNLHVEHKLEALRRSIAVERFCR